MSTSELIFAARAMRCPLEINLLQFFFVWNRTAAAVPAAAASIGVLLIQLIKGHNTFRTRRDGASD